MHYKVKRDNFTVEVRTPEWVGPFITGFCAVLVEALDAGMDEELAEKALETVLSTVVGHGFEVKLDRHKKEEDAQ